MQSYFHSLFCASSSLCLFQLAMKKFLDNFWKPNFPFSCIFFSVNCLLMFYSVCRGSWFLDVNDRPQFCNCSLVALLVLEMRFWFAKSRSKLNFLRCMQVLNVVLKYCSHINGENSINFSFFHCFYEYTCTLIWKLCFFIRKLGYWLNFSRT